MSTIEDGKGSGKKAEVDSENRLLTHSVVESLEHHANISEGEAYQLVFQQTPSEANVCFLYMKNTHPEFELIIEGVLLRTSADEQIEVYLKSTGTASNNTTIPTNVNAGSTNDADGIFMVSSKIIGITSGSIIERFYIKGDKTSIYYNFEQDVIITSNQTMCLHAVNGNVEVDGTLVFYYHH